jgi:hypothetical protein
MVNLGAIGVICHACFKPVNPDHLGWLATWLRGLLYSSQCCIRRCAVGVLRWQVDSLYQDGGFTWGGCFIRVWRGVVEGLQTTFLEPENGHFWRGCIYGRGDDHVRSVGGAWGVSWWGSWGRRLWCVVWWCWGLLRGCY